MTSVINRRAGRSALWMSLLMGACLSLRVSHLPTEAVSVVRAPVATLAAVPAPMLAMSCRIPANFLLPGIKALSHDIARRFHLAESAAASITHAAFAAADVRGIDPTLVLAVAAVESKFKPRAINAATGARGLMQVLPKWHADKVSSVGGEPSLLLIAPNIDVGAAILAEYLDARGGNVKDALERYLGASGADRYVKRVRVEMAHLAKVIKTA